MAQVKAQYVASTKVLPVAQVEHTIEVFPATVPELQAVQPTGQETHDPKNRVYPA